MSEQKQYALFGFNPQMWYRDIGNSKVEICELEQATIWTLSIGETVEQLAERLKNKYTNQTPVVVGAMLVEVKDEMVRQVKVLDKRSKRDWTHLRDYLGE